MEYKDEKSIKERFTKVSKSKVFNRILDYFNLRTKKVLDIGCGYGEYLSCFGKDSLGITTTNEEVEYGKNHNLKIIKGNIEDFNTLKGLGYFDFIWANNLFEHLLSPHSFIIKLKRISKGKTILMLGVPVIPKISSLMKINKFRGPLASNHISFFTKESLKLTVQFAGWKVLCARPFVFKSRLLDGLVSFFAPHLYVVAMNNKDFRYPEKKVKEWGGEDMYKYLFDILENKA